MSFYADKLADAIASADELLTRYLEGFDDDNATAQAPHLPNHAAWIRIVDSSWTCVAPSNFPRSSAEKAGRSAQLGP